MKLDLPAFFATGAQIAAGAEQGRLQGLQANDQRAVGELGDALQAVQSQQHQQEQERSRAAGEAQLLDTYRQQLREGTPERTEAEGRYQDAIRRATAPAQAPDIAAMLSGSPAVGWLQHRGHPLGSLLSGAYSGQGGFPPTGGPAPTSGVQPVAGDVPSSLRGVSPQSPFRSPAEEGDWKALAGEVEDELKAARKAGDTGRATGLTQLLGRVRMRPQGFDLDAAQAQFSGLVSSAKPVTPPTVMVGLRRDVGAAVKDLTPKIAAIAKDDPEAAAPLLNRMKAANFDYSTPEGRQAAQDFLGWARGEAAAHLNAAQQRRQEIFSGRALSRHTSEVDALLGRPEPKKGAAPPFAPEEVGPELVRLWHQEQGLAKAGAGVRAVLGRHGAEIAPIEQRLSDAERLEQDPQAGPDAQERAQALRAQAAAMATELRGRIRKGMSSGQESTALRAALGFLGRMSPLEAGHPGKVRQVFGSVGLDHLSGLGGEGYDGGRLQAEAQRQSRTVPGLAKMAPDARKGFLNEALGLARATRQPFALPAGMIAALPAADRSRLAGEGGLVQLTGEPAEVDRGRFELERWHPDLDRGLSGARNDLEQLRQRRAVAPDQYRELAAELERDEKALTAARVPRLDAGKGRQQLDEVRRRIAGVRVVVEGLSRAPRQQVPGLGVTRGAGRIPTLPAAGF